MLFLFRNLLRADRVISVGREYGAARGAAWKVAGLESTGQDFPAIASPFLKRPEFPNKWGLSRVCRIQRGVDRSRGYRFRRSTESSGGSANLVVSVG